MFERADDVVRAARACIDTPFKHQGRIPGVGIDCAGLAIVAARVAGIFITDFEGYPRQPFDGMLKRMFDEQVHLKKIALHEKAAGDVLLMRIEKAPQHVAIYVGDDYMVHAYANVGKVVEQRIDSGWRNKISAVYRFVL